LSGLPAPAEALIHKTGMCRDFARAGKWPPTRIKPGACFFRIMR
jgi:hypothetical protein